MRPIVGKTAGPIPVDFGRTKPERIGITARLGNGDRSPNRILFQVLTEREERSAIAIASNEPFSGWTKTFTDPRLCAAIVYRLAFAGQIIETGTTSYRLAHARAMRSLT
jgi:hypothetical protein